MAKKRAFGGGKIAAKREVEVDVTFDNETGDVSFEGRGFEGDECIHEMRPLEEAVGDVGDPEFTVPIKKNKFGKQYNKKKNIATE